MLIVLVFYLSKPSAQDITITIDIDNSTVKTNIPGYYLTYIEIKTAKESTCSWRFENKDNKQLTERKLFDKTTCNLLDIVKQYNVASLVIEASPDNASKEHPNVSYWAQIIKTDTAKHTITVTPSNSSIFGINL